MRISYGMAGFLDELMDGGITWDHLWALCQDEKKKRGVAWPETPARLRQHARYGRDHDKWHVVEMNNERVRIVRPVTP
jgi:hypothetical protein